LNRSKDNYYDSIEKAEAKEDKSLMSQNDPKLNQEQKEKINEKALKAREDEKKAHESYGQTLMEIDLYKPQHIKKMTEVFNRTQDFEQQRMLFFKQIFQECHDLIQTHNDERTDGIFEEYINIVNKSNPINDLNWWSRHFGVDTQPNWPQFEEYE
jgi:protein kinase C and casein kinase substrate in neurons protein